MTDIASCIRRSLWPRAALLITAAGILALGACHDDGGITSPVPLVPEEAARALTGPQTEIRITRRESVLSTRDVSQLRVVDASGTPVPASEVIWASGWPGVATVGPDGLVDGVSPGTTVITARRGDAIAQHSVVVVGGGSSSLRLLPRESVLAPGEDRQLKVTNGYGDPIDPAQVSWSSSASSVASVSSTGLVRTDAPGHAIITIKRGEYVAQHGVLVVGEAQAGDGSIERVRGDGQSGTPGSPLPTRPTVRIVDADGAAVPGRTVTWSVRSGGGTVSSSSTTTGSNGEASVIWTLGAESADQVLEAVSTGLSSVRFRATVQSEASPSIRITRRESVLARGDHSQLQVVDEAGNRIPASELTWASGWPGVATVSSEGFVTGVAPGTTVITARKGNSIAQHSAVVVGGGTSSLRLLPRESELTVGDIRDLKVTDGLGNPVDPSSVAWSSSASGVASISPSGRATALSSGHTIVTVRRGDAVAQHGILVAGEGTPPPEGPPPSGSGAIQITNPESVLARGDHSQLQVVDESGHSVPDSELSWSSGSSAVATVSSTGLVTGVAPGTVVIEARRGSAVAHSSAVVVGGGTAAVRILPRETTLATGESKVLRATDALGNAIDESTVSWSSSSPEIVSISSSARITGRSAGVAVITGRRNGYIAQHSVFVTGEAATPTVDRIQVSPGSSSIETGQSVQLRATALDRSGAPVDVAFAWSSDRTDIASVSTGGLVRGESAGTATIRVSAQGVTATHQVSVSETDAPDPTPPSPPSGEWHEPSDFVTAVDEHWNSFEDLGWYHGSNSRGNVDIQNGKLVWTYPKGMVGGYIPGGPVVLEYRHGPYEYHRDEGVTLSPNFHGHQSGVNKFRFWSDVRPKSPLGFFGADHSRLTLGINTGDWPMGVTKLRWNSPDNFASPTQEQAEIVRGVPHDIESLIYVGTPGNADGWLKVWLNGVLVLDFRNLAIVWPGELPRITQIHLAPVWGGMGDEVPETQTISVDRTYVSVAR